MGKVGSRGRKGVVSKESINLLASLKINLKQKFFLWTFPSPEQKGRREGIGRLGGYLCKPQALSCCCLNLEDSDPNQNSPPLLPICRLAGAGSWTAAPQGLTFSLLFCDLCESWDFLFLPQKAFFAD